METLGFDSTLTPCHTLQDDSSMEHHLHLLYISVYRNRFVSHLWHISLCHWGPIHRLEYCLGYPLPHLSDIHQEKAKETSDIRKGGRISIMGICMVLYCMGIELLTAQHLFENEDDASQGFRKDAQGLRQPIC